MKLTILTGSIKKCIQVQMCHRSEVYRRIPKEAEWQILPDELVKKAILIRVSETEYVDITNVKTSLGIVTKMVIGQRYSIFPKKTNDIYVDVDTLKPYYKNPTINIDLNKVRKDIRKYRKLQAQRQQLFENNKQLKLVK